MNTGNTFGSHRERDHLLLEDTTRSSDTSSEASFETASERTLRPSTSQDRHIANAVNDHLAIDVIMQDFLNAMMNGGIVAYWRSNPDRRWRRVLDENNFRALFMRMLFCYLQFILPDVSESGQIAFQTAEQDDDAGAPILDMYDINGYGSQLTVYRARGNTITRCLMALFCESELVPTVITVRDLVWVITSVCAATTLIFALGAYHGAFLVTFVDNVAAFRADVHVSCGGGRGSGHRRGHVRDVGTVYGCGLISVFMAVTGPRKSDWVCDRSGVFN